jgi:cold shock protein
VSPTLQSVPFDSRSVAQSCALVLAMETGMAIGTVKWFNAQKGYGFIAPESGGKDVFVHISAVERAGIGALNEGQKVSFDLEQSQQGRTSATNLKLV